MFPLGNVLFPNMLLPLHVFEERYRVMMDDIAESQEFGVVLIERGSEVGGGDVRAATGTRARVLRAEELDDGRSVLVAAGIKRISVEQWLPDDPYPVAFVADVEEPPPGDCGDLLAAAISGVRKVLALQSELGGPGMPPDVEFANEPTAASFQLAAVAPLGSLDDQRLLEAPDAPARLELLAGLLEDLEAALTQQLALG